MALNHRKTDEPLILHSDRGCQYVSEAYREATEKFQLRMTFSACSILILILFTVLISYDRQSRTHPSEFRAFQKAQDIRKHCLQFRADLPSDLVLP